MSVSLKETADLVTSCVASGARPFVALEHLESGMGRLAADVELPERMPPEIGAASVEPGDVRFGKLRPYLAKSWLADRPVFASTELLCLRPRAGVDSRWLAYLVASNPVVEWAVATSDGTKMPRTSWEKLAEYRMLIPSMDDQRTIADYLDRETSRIDALIGKKQRMSGLLGERRQVLITKAVQGESGPGVAARGDQVNAMTRLKHVVVMRAGGTPSVDDPSMWSEDGTPWVTIGDMTRGRRVVVTKRAVSDDGIQSKRLPVGKPDTLLFAMYASLGATALLGVKASWNQAILGIDAVPHLAEPRFTGYWLQHLRQGLGAIARSNTQDNLNAEQVGNFPFPVMMVITQRIIADYLDRETARIDALVDKIDHQVALLQEHRQALITAAVTGELEVPGVAA